MSRRISPAELEERARKARARETARAAARASKTQTYKPRLDTDYQYLYYIDPLDNERAIRFRVPIKSLTLWGGAAKAGLTATAPTGKGVVEITKGSKIVIFRTQWYYGDSTPVIVPESATHGRYIKFGTEKEGKITHTIPFGDLTDTTPNVDQLIAKWKTDVDTPAEIARLLGPKGRAELQQGYGSKFITLARVEA